MTKILIKEMLNDSFWIMPATPDFINDGVPYITSKNIKEGQILMESAKYISEDDYNRIAKNRPIEANDILISMIGTLGEAAIVKREHGRFYGQNVYLLRLNDKKINHKFFLFFMNSLTARRHLESNMNQSTQRYLKAEHIESLELPNLSLEEQTEAVKILDTLSKIITSRKAQLSEFDTLIKSRFVEVFGESGEEVPLTDFVWFQEGPGVRSVDFRTEGCILLTGSNINDNEISFGYTSDRFISNELAEGKYSHFICDKGDILVVTSAIAPDKFDKKVVVLENEHKYCLNTGIIRFKPNHKHLTNGYFREFLKSMYFKRQVMSEMRGIAQMHFGPSHLKNMTILLPNSLEKQIEFEKFVQHVDKLKVEVQKSLEQTQILFDSLMQEYFE